MADADTIRSTIETYCEAFTDDRDRWLALFADDATVEDPVGTDIHRGTEAIGAFWDTSQSLAHEIVLTPAAEYIKVVGHEAAFAMDARMRSGDDTHTLPIIDVMSFDDAGRITSLRAFWDFADLAPAS